MHKGAFRVHQVELVIKTRPRLRDGGRVRQHAHGSGHFGEISAWHHCWWLIVYADFESRWTPYTIVTHVLQINYKLPVDKLNRTFRFHGCNGRIHIFWH